MVTLDDVTCAAVIFLIVVKSTGYLCLLSLGLGLGLSSWLLCQLYEKISKKVLPKPATNEAEAQHDNKYVPSDHTQNPIEDSTAENQSARGQASVYPASNKDRDKVRTRKRLKRQCKVMGQEHSKYEESIALSDLQRREENLHPSSPTSPSLSPRGNLSATIEHDYNGVLVTGAAPVCCSSSSQSQSCNGNLRQSTEPKSSGSKIEVVAEMGDSGFQENSDQLEHVSNGKFNVDSPTLTSSPRLPQSGPATSHQCNSHYTPSSADITLPEPLQHADITLTDHLGAADITLTDSPGDADVTLSKSYSDSEELDQLHSLQTNARVGRNSQTNPSPRSESLHFWMNLSADFLQPRNLFESDSPPASSASLKRQLYSERHSNTATPSPILSLRDKSRSSSLLSFNGSVDLDGIFDSEFEPNSEDSFQCIDAELPHINAEILDIEQVLDRLTQADTGEWHYSMSSMHRLTRVVSQADPVLTQKEIAKAYHILRKYSHSSDYDEDRFQRVASLPPDCVSNRNLVSSLRRNKTLPSSRSCMEMNRYILHEDIKSNLTLLPVTDTDSTSLCSMSTAETSLNMSLRASSSMESLTDNRRLSPLISTVSNRKSPPPTSAASTTAADKSCDLLTSSVIVEDESIEACRRSQVPDVVGDVTVCSTTGVGEAGQGTAGCDPLEDGLLFDISEYANKEWKGNTKKAETIRKGYQLITTHHGYKHLIQVRGDNYCAVRACLCSMIAQEVQPTSHITDPTFLIQKLDKLHSDVPSLLHSWTFGNNLSQQPAANNKCEVMKCCLYALSAQLRDLLSTRHQRQRLKHLFEWLNSGSEAEVLCLEGIKVLMLLSAYDLYNKYRIGDGGVPVFVWLLFSRDTSANLEGLVINHLNKVGDTAGLDQTEMCLLGYALGLTLTVFRPYLADKDDFVSEFPDRESMRNSDLAAIPLISEDDRHYNVLTTVV